MRLGYEREKCAVSPALLLVTESSLIYQSVFSSDGAGGRKHILRIHAVSAAAHKCFLISGNFRENPVSRHVSISSDIPLRRIKTLARGAKSLASPTIIFLRLAVELRAEERESRQALKNLPSANYYSNLTRELMHLSVSSCLE